MQVTPTYDDIKVQARGVHFFRHGQSLIVSYLDHGFVYVLVRVTDVVSDFLTFLVAGTSNQALGYGRLKLVTPVA